MLWQNTNVLFYRSVVGAVIYAITPPNDSSHYKSQLTAYFMAGKFCKLVKCYDLVLTQQQGMAFFHCWWNYGKIWDSPGCQDPCLKICYSTAESFRPWKNYKNKIHYQKGLWDFVIYLLLDQNFLRPTMFHCRYISPTLKLLAKRNLTTKNLLAMLFKSLHLDYYKRNFCNLIGLEQWYFSLTWNTLTCENYKPFAGSSINK